MILFLEAFYGGSHKQLVDLLYNEFKDNADLVTLPDRKWHWRARVGSLMLAERIPLERSYNLMFCSAVFNLGELLGLRPDLINTVKILYFHENQLVYPVQVTKQRDFQYGYNQILSALVADKVCFNSAYNMDSFLSHIKGFLKLIPNYKPVGIVKKIRDKSCVLHYPIRFPPKVTWNKGDNPLHIVWPHRWEHDKNPALLLRILSKLKENQAKFQLSVIGEQYNEIPAEFETIKSEFAENMVHWGYIEKKSDYYTALSECDVVLSTAKHEFFGVAMLEAVHLGCYPIAPNNLVYPEIFPAENLFKKEKELYQKLTYFCAKPSALRQKPYVFDTFPFSWDKLKREYTKLVLHQAPASTSEAGLDT